MFRSLAAGLVLLLFVEVAAVGAAETLSAGFGSTDITPDVKGKTPVYIAGYGQNRKATGVHDPLYARAIVLSDGKQKIAIAAADVVGLQYPVVEKIRKKLEGFDYVLVAATHNHEGPDTMGIWGPTPFKSGIDPKYLDHVIDQVAAAIKKADANLAPVSASYGTAADEKLLRDSREPYVKDDIIRVVRFDGKDKKPHCLLVNWTCHPEALASENTEITADFPYYTIRDLEKKYGCPVLYMSGAVGGLMAPPRDIYQKADGSPLGDGSFEYCEKLGTDVAKIGMQAIDSSSPVKLTPFVISAKQITVPLENTVFRAAMLMKLLDRSGVMWTGDFEEIGRPFDPIKDAKHTPAGITEVAYVKLGDVDVAAIPGEVYPESVYGKVQDPVDPGADYPDAPIEPSVVETLPSKKFLLFGLANDELGYIVPKRQWDTRPPFCYGRDKDQYGEGNSCGPEMAPCLYGALKKRVEEAQGK